MSKKVILFGVGQMADVAWHALIHESDYTVAGWTLDKEYRKINEHRGKPVVDFESVEQYFPPDEYHMLLPISFRKVNQFRKQRFIAAKRKGYHCIHHVSPQAIVPDDMPIGENTIIYAHAVIQPFVSIAENVTLWTGVHIAHHTTVQAHCFMATRAVISGACTIEEACFFGANTTTHDNIVVGAHSVIGAGSVVRTTIAPNSVLLPASSGLISTPSHRLTALY